MPLRTVTPPSALPIDIAEARLHVRKDLTDEDLRITRAIQGCTAWAQGETQRTLVATRYKLTIDAFPGPTLMGVPSGNPFSIPGSAVLLERGPAFNVVSVKYLDMTGTQQTLAATEYAVDLSAVPARITPKFGKIWPVTLPQIGAVEIVFDAGMVAPVVFDATANTVTVKGPWNAYAVGDVLRFTNSGGGIPLPLALYTDYYVQAVTGAGVYTLAATPGGAVIDLADAGSGTHFVGEMPTNVINWMLLRVGSLFEHREAEIAMERGTLQPQEYIDRLLDDSRAVLY